MYAASFDFEPWLLASIPQANILRKESAVNAYKWSEC
jgi:hypothetical protein